MPLLVMMGRRGPAIFIVRSPIVVARSPIVVLRISLLRRHGLLVVRNGGWKHSSRRLRLHLHQGHRLRLVRVILGMLHIGMLHIGMLHLLTSGRTKIWWRPRRVRERNRP
jgi:hypothetical protein